MKTTLSNEVKKYISKEKYYNEEQFTKDAKRYIKAIKEGRIICLIASVSKSGMSRTIRFMECKKAEGINKYYYLNYNQFFRALGYSQAGDNFRIGGCGMDMIFHTNYTNIRNLHRMGFLNKKDCDKLAQETPTTIS